MGKEAAQDNSKFLLTLMDVYHYSEYSENCQAPSEATLPPPSSTRGPGKYKMCYSFSHSFMHPSILSANFYGEHLSVSGTLLAL